MVRDMYTKEITRSAVAKLTTKTLNGSFRMFLSRQITAIIAEFPKVETVIITQYARALATLCAMWSWPKLQSSCKAEDFVISFSE